VDAAHDGALQQHKRSNSLGVVLRMTKRKRKRRPNGRVIWVAKDQSGTYAYNHKPRTRTDVCDSCGGKVQNFAGTPEKDCWELCDEALKVLHIRALKHGEVRRYERQKEPLTQ
jgi:hypothetical protein